MIFVFYYSKCNYKFMASACFIISYLNLIHVSHVFSIISAQATSQPEVQQQPPMGGLPQQGAPGQGPPPFMPQGNYPGMPGGFTPSMVPPGMAGFPGPMPGAQAQQAAPQMPAQTGPDTSVVAHKLPSSQVCL
jgi:hypothetical protein